MTDLLLQHGADPDLRDWQVRTTWFGFLFSSLFQKLCDNCPTIIIISTAYFESGSGRSLGKLRQMNAMNPVFRLAVLYHLRATHKSVLPAFYKSAVPGPLCTR